METRSAGLLLVILGVLLVGIGLLVYIGTPAWFGRLPGDFRFDRGSSRIYVPVTSMVLASVILSLLLSLLRRLL